MPVSITFLCGDPGSNYLRDWLASNANLNEVRSVRELSTTSSDILFLGHSYWSSRIPTCRFKKVVVFDLCDEYWRYRNITGDNVYYGKLCYLTSDPCRMIALPYITLMNYAYWIKRHISSVSYKRKGICFYGSSTSLMVKKDIDDLGLNLNCEEVRENPVVKGKIVYGKDIKSHWHTHQYFQRLNWLKHFEKRGIEVTGGLVDRGNVAYLSQKQVCAVYPGSSRFFTSALSHSDAISALCSSELALCPSGHGLWSNRLYEAQSARCTLVCPDFSKVSFLYKPASYIPVGIHEDPADAIEKHKDNVCTELNTGIENITEESLFNQAVIDQLEM